MKLLLLLLVSIAAWGTASPSAITVYMRQQSAYPVAAFRAPEDRAITVTGAGAWSISRGGNLSTTCSAANGYCFSVSTATNSDTAGCSGTLPTGSGDTTLYLCWRGHTTSQLTAGTHTGSVTISGTTIAITLIVVPPNAFSAWTSLTGFPSGCSTPANYDTAATCSITNERPTSTAFAIPAPGGTYVDPQFGNTVTRVTPSNQNIQYGALRAFNSDGSMVLTATNTGVVSAYNRTGTVAYASIPGPNINNASWDGGNPDVLWWMDGATLKKRVLSTSTTTTAADYTLSSGARPAMTGIYMGGTVDITEDNWWAFRDGTTVCAVNLTGLTTSNQESQTYCASYAALSLTDIDFTQITQVDSESRKRYVIVVAAPAAHMWSVGAAGLDYECRIPSGAVDVPVEPHSDVGADELGRQVFWWHWYSPYDNRYYLGSVQLNKGLAMAFPVEAGGGLRIHSNTHYDNFVTDSHFSCNWRGLCTSSNHSDQLTSKFVSSITATNPCVLNVTGHGYANGTSVQVGGATGTGTSILNGIFTMTSTGTNTFTIPVNCSAGVTYTADSAHVALSSQPADAPFRNTIILSRLGQWSRQVVMTRARLYEGGALSGYYSTPRASISRDGRYIAFASNMGVPEIPSTYVVDVGFDYTARISAAVHPADTKAVFNYVVPAGQGVATITISTAAALTSPVVSASDGLTVAGRQYVASGLTADTLYHYRIATTGHAYTGQFRTLATLSGNGRLQVSKGGGGTVQYGTTTGLGSSCTSPCDIAIARGVVYTDVTGAVVVR